MIRWLSSEGRIFAYYKNFVLIACFLGFGLGCALCRRRVHPIATAIPMLFFAVPVAAPFSGMHDAVTDLTTLIGMTSQVQIWEIATPDWRCPGRNVGDRFASHWHPRTRAHGCCPLCWLLDHAKSRGNRCEGCTHGRC